MSEHTSYRDYLDITNKYVRTSIPVNVPTLDQWHTDPYKPENDVAVCELRESSFWDGLFFWIAGAIGLFCAVKNFPAGGGIINKVSCILYALSFFEIGRFVSIKRDSRHNKKAIGGNDYYDVLSEAEEKFGFSLMSLRKDPARFVIRMRGGSDPEQAKWVAERLHKCAVKRMKRSRLILRFSIYAYITAAAFFFLEGWGNSALRINHFTLGNYFNIFLVISTVLALLSNYHAYRAFFRSSIFQPERLTYAGSTNYYTPAFISDAFLFKKDRKYPKPNGYIKEKKAWLLPVWLRVASYIFLLIGVLTALPKDDVHMPTDIAPIDTDALRLLDHLPSANLIMELFVFIGLILVCRHNRNSMLLDMKYVSHYTYDPDVVKKGVYTRTDENNVSRDEALIKQYNDYKQAPKSRPPRRRRWRLRRRRRSY